MKEDPTPVHSLQKFKEKAGTPKFIKLRDKISFVLGTHVCVCYRYSNISVGYQMDNILIDDYLGVCNVALTAFIIAKFPDSMPLLYTIKSIVLLGLRLYVIRLPFAVILGLCCVASRCVALCCIGCVVVLSF